MRMNSLEKLLWLNAFLLQEMPQHTAQAERFPKTWPEQRALLRSLMNVRPPLPLQEAFLQVQDEVLREEVQKKGVVLLQELAPVQKNLYIWQGDITRLGVDAIVNAANSALLGCFIPCHTCIDNAIHSVAGLQLRNECHTIMQEQNHAEKTGDAKITEGYNLPSSYVIHTVGPIVEGALQDNDRKLLKNCYRAVLELAVQKGIESLAFCCISTGEFHFPNKPAAEIAVKTVQDFQNEYPSEMKVIFNVFKDIDAALYHELLTKN